MKIHTSVESRRGCGYRSPGGLYLAGDAFGETCHRLPFALDICPTCGHGIRQSRAWTWINGYELFKLECRAGDSVHCYNCIICRPVLFIPTDEVKEGEEYPNRGLSGLIWVGEKYYRFPETFIAEANRMHINRRIHAVPQGFVIGETWVFLAHVKAIFKREDSRATYTPGVFRAYKPTGIEYVVRGDETDATLEKMIKRGITPVKVEKEGMTSEMDLAPPRERFDLSIEGFVSPGTTNPTARLNVPADPNVSTADLLLPDTPISRKASKALKAHGLEYVQEYSL